MRGIVWLDKRFNKTPLYEESSILVQEQAGPKVGDPDLAHSIVDVPDEDGAGEVFRDEGRRHCVRGGESDEGVEQVVAGAS
ncbi:hypothetical protein Syun_010131 [Stephania yunnanensis]|uniref:Uncharacterized protein n=1 Tax=Stephania yunnanensis TaxID=152371 RepID=A0AAP0PPQ3_9MAGN